jgi:hypothetical protein
LTASTHGNDYFEVNCKFIALLIACVIFGAVFAAKAVRAQSENNTQASELVKVTGEAVNFKHDCIQVVNENRQAIHSSLTFRLRITNVSSRPLIIYRHAPVLWDSRLSATLAVMPNAKFRFAQRPALPNAPPRDFEEAAPTREFRILQPNEFWVYEDQVMIFSGESLNGAFLQLKAATWLWEVASAEQLRERWASYGDLFYQDVTVEPFALTITKPGAATPRCGTL